MGKIGEICNRVKNYNKRTVCTVSMAQWWCMYLGTKLSLVPYQVKAHAQVGSSILGRGMQEAAGQ